MASERHVNQAGVELIKRSEGFRAQRYLCPAGRPTIGYGHVILAGEAFDEPLSQDQAERLLRQDLAQVESRVSDLARVPLNDNQFAALVSFAYNLGVGSLTASTLLKKLNAGDYAGAAAEFMRWNKARVKGRKRVLAGLTARRRAETELFMTPPAQA